METIAVVDTSICTNNLGDEIIMDAVNAVVEDLFPHAYILRVPSHEALSRRTHRFIEQASVCFIGGTNLLSSNLRRKGQWRIGPDDASVYGATHTVCLGTGWSDYMPTPSPRTQSMLRKALSRHLVHAARDSYTRDRLKGVGLSAATTSCPTTWSLTPAHCATVPRARAGSAVITLSAWRPEPEKDRAMVDAVRRHYQRIWFFPQMIGDYEYFRSFGWDDVRIAATTTAGYTRFLHDEKPDFIGTRLHGGIRALQQSCRALIIAIDNRAAEIAKDTGLPVLARDAVADIETWIEGGASTAMSLPQDAIDQWKRQFTAENLQAMTRPEPDFRQTVLTAARRQVRAARGLMKGLTGQKALG